MSILTTELTINGMRVKTTKNPPSQQSQTFYVSSQHDPDKDYVVRSRSVRTMFFDFKGNEIDSCLIPIHRLPNYAQFEYLCNCSDFVFRGWSERKDCKHVEGVKGLVSLTGSPYDLAAKLQAL